MVSILNEREKLYRLIISQLRYDGHEQIAQNLTQAVRPRTPCPPTAHLLQLSTAKHQNNESIPDNSVKLPGLTPPIEGGKGIDLECEPTETKATEIGMYETYYVTAHKGACRTACFSLDGKLIATGSADASIKVLDVDRMIVKTTMPTGQDHVGSGTGMEGHPVIRTLYDHTDEITAIAMHPSAPIVISGGKDCSIKFFDISKPSVKKSYRSIQDVEVINSLSFHPSGDFIVVGTEHPTIRLYEVNTLQCYVASNIKEYHTAPITRVSYSPSGHLYASSSKDGSIKVWDGVSNRCISTFPNAHNGSPVSAVTFSKNSKYLLSNGKDSLVFLWELSTGRAVSMYTGVKSSMQNNVGATFNHTEDYIFLPDNMEKSSPLGCWDTRTTEKLKTLPSGHNGLIGCVQHSPTAKAFVTCSDDYRARFWYSEGI